MGRNGDLSEQGREPRWASCLLVAFAMLLFTVSLVVGIVQARRDLIEWLNSK